MEKEIYNLSWNNLDKDIPKNYDTLIIPEIEKVCKNIPGDLIKNKIYNYVIYYYNNGIKNGVLSSILIYSNNKTKKIIFKIRKDSIKLQLC